MQKGQLQLYFNYELDELFVIKRGVIFGKWLLETDEGTSLFENLEDLIKSSNLYENSILLEDDF